MEDTVALEAPIFVTKCVLSLFPKNFYRMVLLTLLFGFNKDQH